jgi:excisionase family DNA binding protein
MKHLSVEQIAEDLNFDPETVRRWLRMGELKGYKFGRPWRVKQSDFDKFCEERGM